MTLIRQLWYILDRRERLEGLLLLCCMAFGALLEAMSVALVVPFVAALQDPRLVLESRILQPLLTAVDVRRPEQLLAAAGLCLVGAFIVKSGYLVLLYRWLFRFIFAKQVALSRRLLTGYLNAPYTFHLDRNSAELIKAMTGTLQGFTAGFLLNLLTVLGEALVVVALVMLLMVFDALTTLGTVIALAIPTAIIYLRMRRRLAVSGRTAEESFASVIQWTEQAIGGIKATLVMGRNSYFVDQHGRFMRTFADSWRTVALLSTMPRLVIDTLALSAIVAIVLVSLVRGPELQQLLPVLGMFAVAAIRLMPSATRIANGLAQLRFLYATLEVIHGELRALDGVRPPQPDGTAQDRESPLRFERSLVLERVSYAYPNAPRPIIDDVTLEVQKGHWVALVGPTGAGKTTLVDLMLGLLTPTSGRILIDGRDLKDHVGGWRRNVGYVPQDIYLLDDTVRRNIAFALPDDAIDDEQVWRALRGAEVDHLVRSLPDRLNATIGQRGSRLSGGERQRLAIARALYHDPQVLVVDEGTANLDNETETAIVDTLTGLRGQKTIVVVAHRLTMVRNSDRIYFVRQGSVKSAGNYRELLANDSSFRQFASAEN